MGSTDRQQPGQFMFPTIRLQLIHPLPVFSGETDCVLHRWTCA